MLVLVAATAAALVAAGSAVPAGTDFAAFRTPSGNIGCIYSTGPTYLRCDIRSRLRPKPPRPKGCLDLEWAAKPAEVVPFRLVPPDEARPYENCIPLYSLADRACLALAMRLGLPALTTDRAWAELDLPVEVVVLR